MIQYSSAAFGIVDNDADTACLEKEYRIAAGTGGEDDVPGRIVPSLRLKLEALAAFGTEGIEEHRGFGFFLLAASCGVAAVRLQ